MSLIAASIFALALTVAIAPTPANATLITWDYEADFDSSGTASGSFVFDTDDSSFSDVEITIISGTQAGTYDTTDIYALCFDVTCLEVLDTGPGPPTPNNDWFIQLIVTPGFDDLAATITSTSLFQCTNGSSTGCETGDNTITASSSSLTGSVAQVSELPVAQVPEPSSVLLFGVGLIGLVGLGRRRRRKESLIAA